MSALGILLCWGACLGCEDSEGIICGVRFGDWVQVLVSCTVEVLDEAVRVELRWVELVVDDFQALL